VIFFIYAQGLFRAPVFLDSRSYIISPFGGNKNRCDIVNFDIFSSLVVGFQIKNWRDMDVEAYLLWKRMDGKELATLAKVSPSTISKCRLGKGLPALGVAQKIVDATKGKITIKDMVEFYEKKRRKK
jgi:hypothetical protein